MHLGLHCHYSGFILENLACMLHVIVIDTSWQDFLINLTSIANPAHRHLALFVAHWPRRLLITYGGNEMPVLPTKDVLVRENCFLAF